MHDVIIIGAGPAGLVAATHLARLNRPPLVIDGGDSRARWISTDHNIPALLGRNGAGFLERLRAQARHYGADIRRASVRSLARHGARFSVDLHGEICFARFVLLATGVKDHLPMLPDASEQEVRRALKVCPACDAFEARGKKVAVLGRGAQGERQALFLRAGFSSEVTYIHLGKVHDPTSRSRLTNAGVTHVSARLADLSLSAGHLQVDGVTAPFEVCYSALGSAARDALAIQVGARRGAEHSLEVNLQQQTSVDGLYAAGDVVGGLDQITVATAEAALAAADIHRRLLLS